MQIDERIDGQIDEQMMKKGEGMGLFWWGRGARQNFE